MPAPPVETLRSKFRAACKACAAFAEALDEKVGVTRFLFGRGIAHNYKAKQSAIEASILLLGLVVSGTLALGVAIHEKGEVGWIPLSLYLGGSLVPVGAMTFLLRASSLDTSRSKSVHWFDPITVRMTQWNLVGSFILVCATVGLVWAGVFPGQPIPKTVYFTAGNPQAYASKDFPKKSALTFDIHIDEDRYPDGVPEFLPLTIMLTSPLKDSWEILRADGFKLIDGKEKKDREEKLDPGPYYIDTDTRHKKGIFWQNLERKARYLLRVYIYSMEENLSPEQVEEVHDLITEGKGITVLDEPAK